ncbi:PfkB family carbohydrate kinase [Celeribacter sp. ULVN23_4]
MTGLRLAAVGDNCIDRFLTQKIARVGGNALNVAVHFAKAGHDAAYFGAVGDDEDGRWTRQELVLNAVNVDGLDIRPEMTAYTNIAHNAEGDRQFLFEEFGASAAYFPGPDAIKTLRAADHVHFGLLNESELLCEKLKGRGVTVSVDCAVNPLTSAVDLAFGSVGEDLPAAQAEMERLLALGHGLVVVTRGAEGAMASDGTNTWSIAGKPIQAVDTTGAGDTFIAHFIATWKMSKKIETVLDRATMAAAANCLYLGGFPQDGRVLPS